MCEKALALLWKGVLRIIKNLIRSIGVFKTVAYCGCCKANDDGYLNANKTHDPAVFLSSLTHINSRIALPQKPGCPLIALYLSHIP